MTNDWFIVRGGKEIGPYTAQQLKEMATNGKLASDALVRRSDMQAPRKAGTIKGLFAVVEVAPTKPSAPPSETGVVTPPLAQKKARPSKKLLLIASVVAGACLFLCCGGLGLIAMFGMKMEDTTRKQLAEGDALWDKGDKPGAVGKYRDIIDNQRAVFLKEEDRPRLYGHVIDYEYAAGHADAGKNLIDEANKNNIAPTVSHPDAKAVMAAKQAKREQAEANKKMEGKSVVIKHDRYTQVIMPELPPEPSTTRKRASLNGTSGKWPFPTCPKWTSCTARTASQSRW